MSDSGVTAKVLFDYTAEQDDELTLAVGEIITNVIQDEGGWWKGEIKGKSGVFPENFVSLVNNQQHDQKRPISFKALVKFDYDPEQSDELELKEGQVVDDIVIVDEGWWKGKCNGKMGMFPSNFVEKLADSKETIVEKGKSKAEAEEGIKLGDPVKEPHQSNIMASLFSGINPGEARNKLKKLSNKSVEETPLPPAPFQQESPKPSQVVQPLMFDHEETKKKTLPLPADLSKHPKVVQKAKVIFDYEPEQPDELKLDVGMIVTVIASELTFEGWMKGEVNGKVGVFPDNFVELLPLETSSSSSVDVKEESLPKPVLASPLIPPGGNVFQNELNKKLASRPQSSGSPPLPQFKAAGKAPPPPLPGNKPSLPGTKPKPAVNNKPSKPPIVKADFGSSVQESKPKVPSQPQFSPSNNTGNSLPQDSKTKASSQPQFSPSNTAKASTLGLSSPKIPSKSPAIKKEEIEGGFSPGLSSPKAASKFPANKKEETEGGFSPGLSSPKTASKFPANKKEETEGGFSPGLSSPKTPSKFPANKKEETEGGFSPGLPKTPSTFPAIKKEEIEGGALPKKSSSLNKESHSTFDTVQPTEPLKHFDRPRQPGKTPPSKHKDKISDSSIIASSNIAFDDHTDCKKEINELKLEVAEIQNKMADMDKKFKKLLVQVTDDLDNERKLRLSQEVEIGNLKKKLGVLLE